MTEDSRDVGFDGAMEDAAVAASLSDGFVIDDGANLRRVKALAATVPIEDLDRSKSSLSGSFWHLYDLRTLAIAAIDWIALALGVSSGASPEAAAASLPLRRHGSALPGSPRSTARSQRACWTSSSGMAR